MRNKELKMKFEQLQEEISKASLPVSADLSNDFKSIIFETDQRNISPFNYFRNWPKKHFTLYEVILGEAAKIFIIFPK